MNTNTTDKRVSKGSDDKQSLSSEALTRLSSDALNQSVEQLSPEVIEQLANARKIALSKHASTKKGFRELFILQPKLLIPAFASVFGLALVMGDLIAPATSKQAELFASIQNSDNLENFVIYSGTDQIELDIIEDIEFAIWLSQELADEQNIPAQEELGV